MVRYVANGGLVETAAKAIVAALLVSREAGWADGTKTIVGSSAGKKRRARP